ncbi:hypothetical protein FIBSPDRAFT_865507 [Athelia psychrophila]|uniref:GST C-terminal domain-containing protein n=1 Tax=Athelia psychrophila TaxID=1759441 RepID=A0A166FFP9_9AGAM|nr:hypothetical protein FIBSPDRAFT_865507 [Fibularhizoctonia sp. CBS 109695]
MKNAKTKVKASTESDLAFITKIHANEYDPNFPILSARNDDELSAKSAGFAMQFLANRQSALEKHSAHEDGADHKDFYDSKIQGNGHVLSIYQSKTSPSAKENFFAMSTAHWDKLRKFILEDLRDDLPAQGFLGGDVPGEADFHVAAWLARIAAAGGAKKTEDGLKMLQNEVGPEAESPIPDNVASYWNAWVKRESWAQVYGQDLH